MRIENLLHEFNDIDLVLPKYFLSWFFAFFDVVGKREIE